MKKHIPTITIFIIIIGIIVLGIYFSDKNSPIKQLAKLDVYSKEELSFLEKEGFLDAFDSENLPSSKEQIISLLKSPGLIEQDINTADGSFEVLATKLDENTYQLAFKLENKSNESKEFYLIPISDESQLQFKEIKGRISGTITEAYNTPLTELYDVNQHKSELKPELAQAYIDIEYNNYQAKPIKLVLEANSTLLAQSKWQINRDRVSDSLKPVYLLVYGSAGGAKDELTIIDVHSYPQQGGQWKVSFETKGLRDLIIIPEDQNTINDMDFVSLKCGDEERTPQILENDVILYKYWYCSEEAEIIHIINRADYHTLKFQFGSQEAFAYNNPGLTDNLISYWKLDDNLDTNVVIDSHGTNPGTVVNNENNRSSEQSTEVAKIVRAFDLDGGNDYVNIADDTDFDITDNLSVFAWIKEDVLEEDNVIVGKYATDKGEWALRKGYLSGAPDGSDEIEIIFGDADGGFLGGWQTTVGMMTTGTWFHVGFTYSSGTVVIYINGVARASELARGSVPASLNNEDASVTIGARVSTTFFDGTIDEVAIWDRVLDSTDVTALYNGGAGLAYPLNSAPTISSVSDYPDPIETGNTITFSLDWNDADAGEEVKIHICKTDTLSGSYTCETSQDWCETESPSTDDPETCTYITQSGDVGSNTYYAFVCDDSDACSSSTSGTFTVGAVSTPSIKFPGGVHFKGGTIFK